jgi:hypothetical protein
MSTLTEEGVYEVKSEVKVLLSNTFYTTTTIFWSYYDMSMSSLSSVDKMVSE